LAAGTVAGDSVRYEQVALLAGSNLAGSLNDKRSTVAATATTTLMWDAANGNVQDWTGTPTITNFPAAPQAGARRTVYPAAGTIFTDNANIDVQGDANYTVAAGDKIYIEALTTTTFKVFIEAKVGVRADSITASSLDDSALGMNMINGTLVPTVGANALTMSIKTKEGTDPTATNPVLVIFRNATLATGDYTVLSITAALSFTISSGSTLGTTNNTAFKLWWVIFNDAGTARLGAIRYADPTNLTGARTTQVISSTAEGGAGGADSAFTFYTGIAAASKAYTTVGFSIYETGLATAGTWSAIPTSTQLLNKDSYLPGQIIRQLFTSTGTVATGTTTIPGDNTIPQITEGDQYLSRNIAPSSASSILEIEVYISMLASSVANGIAVALFQDSTANALAAAHASTSVAGFAANITLKHIMLAGTSASTTFSVRIGGNAAGTITFNGSAGAQFYGGVLASKIIVREIAA
jgi:hypothetical protein